MLYTDGAKHVAEAGGAYWLLDHIAAAQSVEAVAPERYQVWKLTVTDRHGVLACEDGNDHCVYSQEFGTDFPLPEITLWFTNRTIMLPGEY